MIVESTAPTRIDLAGGTVDIWPIYLLYDEPLTVNVAIDLVARCRIEKVKGEAVRIESLDQGLKVSARSLDALPLGGPLDLPVRLARRFARGGGFRLITKTLVPAGSGLGGSSSLAIAVASALLRFTGERMARETLLATVKDIEAQVIRVPTGWQDYYPALYGGLAALWWRPGGAMREPLSLGANAARELSERIVLAYTGAPRFSGMNNWAVTKKCVDGDRRTRRIFEEILDASHRMKRALESVDYDAVGEALDEEWRSRRRLAPTIASPQILRIMQGARRAGAIGGKVCGAGGGGCIVFVAGAGKRMAVEKAIRQAGGSLLGFKPALNGVKTRLLQS